MNMFVVTGLLVGAGYGYAAQRGAFCMNSGVRVIVTKRDTTKLKAYILAIAVQMVLLSLLMAFGIFRPTFPSFFPVGAVVGGLLFGASMRWAGGCAAGVWYKAGSGSLNAVFGIVGMALGAIALETGPLVSLRKLVQSVSVSNHLPALLKSWGLSLWMLMLFVGVFLLIFLWRTAVTQAGDWSWRRTGLWIGLVGVLAWPLSILAGRHFGMAVLPGTMTLFTGTFGNYTSLFSWDLFFVFGISLGAFIAVSQQKRAFRASRKDEAKKPKATDLSVRIAN